MARLLGSTFAAGLGSRIGRAAWSATVDDLKKWKCFFRPTSNIQVLVLVGRLQKQRAATISRLPNWSTSVFRYKLVAHESEEQALMLTWLASYPRSGNTYTRILLKSFFGQDTFSVHEAGDVHDFVDVENVGDIVGHRNWNVAEGYIDEARRSDRHYVVKTHILPIDDAPAIYVVRDGRSTLVSFYHYVRRMWGADYSMDQILSGSPFNGELTWSDHIKGWDPQHRKNTLIIRYEQMVANPHSIVNDLSRFLGRDPLRADLIDFSELQRRHPRFFRAGDDTQNIKEMLPHLRKFCSLNGDAMCAFGYMTPAELDEALGEPTADLPPEKWSSLMCGFAP